MTKKYPKLLKSTEKYSKLLTSTLKYPKVPKSIQKYIQVRGDHIFSQGTTNLARNTQNDKKKFPKLKSTDKYSKLLICTLLYPKVPKSTQKYIKVKGGPPFFFTRGHNVAKNAQNNLKSTQQYSKVQKNTQDCS